MPVNPRALTGFASSAAAYDRARPTYPDAAVASAWEQLGLGPGSTVLDLAAGTGKLTRLLEPRAGRVVAVEPSDAMRAVLERSLPRGQALAGTAEEIPLDAASVDAVFVGEAFHWFETAAAAAEIARVLRPRGGLAVLFNEARWDEAENPWLVEFRRLVGPHRPADRTVALREGDWEPAVAATGLFDPPAGGTFGHTQRLDAQGFVSFVSSWSWIATLEDVVRGAVLEGVRELVAGTDEVALRYATELIVMRAR